MSHFLSKSTCFVALLGLLTLTGCDAALEQIVNNQVAAIDNQPQQYGPFKLGMPSAEVAKIIRAKSGQAPEQAVVQVPGFDCWYYDQMHLMLFEGKLHHVMMLDGSHDDD
jgi:hypothetical protein